MKPSKSHKLVLAGILTTVAMTVQAQTRLAPDKEVVQEFQAVEHRNSFSTPNENRPVLGKFPVEADELHYVGYYEGAPDRDSPTTDISRPAGSAKIKVSRPGRSVALVLTAYEPIVWKIECDETTTISHVILSGYHEQFVEANSALLSAKVVASTYDTPGLFKYFQFHGNNRSEIDETVYGLTGMTPNSLHCGYTAKEPILIDAVLRDGKP